MQNQNERKVYFSFFFFGFTISPLMCLLIELSIELSHRDTFGVEDMHIDFGIALVS